MKFSQCLAIVCILSITSCGAEPPSAQQPAICDIGPIPKSFGGTDWDVYSCRDVKMIVATSAPGNPAMPFYFALTLKDGSYELVGEGTGSKAATAPAADALSKLTLTDIESIIAETKAK